MIKKYDFYNLNNIPNTSGIYMITNTINNKSYIGQSIHLRKRLTDHRCRSHYSGDREYNKTFYRSIRKYGIENFTIQILEECDKEFLDERETYWIEFYDTYNNGYNETTGGGSGQQHIKGEKHPNHKLTEKDIIDIRTRYNNHERKKEVYSLYKDRINFTGFHKIWTGTTWKNIMMDVYTEENKKFHLHNTGQSGSSNGKAKLNEKQVYDIRLRKKNGESFDNVYEDYSHLLTKGSFQCVWYNQNWKNIIV